MRHKRENAILVGLIPGPKEASQYTNSCLHVSPLVLELHQAWKDGFTIMSPHQIPAKGQLA